MANKIKLNLKEYHLSTIQELGLSEENLLNNESLMIAWMQQGTNQIENNVLSCYEVLDLKKNESDKLVSWSFSGKVNGKTIFFDSKGISSDKDIILKIALSDIKMPKSNSLVITRSVIGEDGEEKTETVTLNSLNFREQIALQILTKFLEKEENLVSIEDSKVKKYVKRAFDFSQEFINQAIEKRSADATVEEPIYKVKIIEEASSTPETT